MRRSFFVIISIALLLSFSTIVMASGVAITGIGARAMALAGNYRGVANDWSSMFWNPAGLAQIKGLHAGLSFETIMPGSKYTLTQNVPVFGLYNTAEFGNESRTFFIPAMGVVYGTDKLSFGLSVYAPFGLGSKWDAMNTKTYNDAYPEFEFESDLQIIDIHPTIAFKATEKLSVGVGLGLVMSNITIRKPTTTPNPLLFDPANAALKPLFTALGLAGSNYNHLLTDTELEGEGMGFSASFGLQYKLTETITIGASGNWYNDISLDGKITANTYYAKTNSQTLTALGTQLTGLGVPAAQQQQILGVYSGVKQVKYDQAKADAKLPLPMTLGAGFAFTGIENLLISGDVSWTQWSAWDVIELDMVDPKQQDSELVQKWLDGVRFGLGMEYQAMELLTLRAGYYTEPSAIPDETLAISIPDINRRHGINLGATFNLGPLALHASYEKLLIGDRTVDKWVYNPQALGYENMAGSYKMSVNNIMLGLGYNF